MSKPLSGVKVLEIAGLAPAPFAGMVLADFGADVVRVDRVDKDGDAAVNTDTLARGKKSIAINLKSPKGIELFKELVKQCDVVIEPFRPGVMERLGLGPDVLCGLNPRLIYARMTGFGQGGESGVEKAAGHDINYIAVSGALSTLRSHGQAPQPPINLLGDFAGGGLMCAMGVLLALLERHNSGQGQVVDAAMTDGAAYVSSFVYRAHLFGQWKNDLDTVGTNVLDGGAPFYATYECKCGNYFSVGSIEPQFYKALLQGLELDASKLPSQSEKTQWDYMREVFKTTFMKKTRDEWTKVFDGTDACAFPILSINEAHQYSHNVKRGTFVQSADTDGMEPRPAPVLSRTPGFNPRPSPSSGEDVETVLREYGFSDSKIKEIIASKIVATPSRL